MFESLQGQRVVIIGASSGIGLATAKLLDESGAELVLANRNIEKLNNIAKKVLTRKTSNHRLDVTVEEDVKAFFEEIAAFDHLVVPAAGAVMGTLADSPTESTRLLVDSKFWGQYFVVKYGTRQITKDGSITMFSGTVSQKPIPGASAYAAVGAAIEAASRIWALEYAPIRINTIVPGIIDTPIWEAMLGKEGAGMQLEQIANALPVQRVGTSTDVAKAAIFLIDNGFVNGTTIVVDGGHRLV